MPWEGLERPPRRWQAEALPALLTALDEGTRGIVVACTGAGKSVLMAELVREVLKGPRSGPIVVTAPTQRLVRQLGATLAARVGVLGVGLFFADEKVADRPVIVACNASAGALAAQVRSCHLWIADEAHRSEATELVRAVEALAPARSLGFTATPFRAVRAEKLRFFAQVLWRYSLRDALADGVVVPWRTVPWTGGEMDLADALAAQIKRHTEGPGAINARSIAEAELLAERLRGHGLAVEAVHSQLAAAEQDERLGRLERGELRAVTYPSLLQEGVDLPWLRWLGLARRVTSAVRIVQELGRAIRAAPGKAEAVILDMHGIMEGFAVDLAEQLGQTDEEAEATAAAERAEKEAAERGVLELERIRPLNAVASWIAQLSQAAEADGLLRRDRPRFGGDLAPSQRQIAMLTKMSFATRWLPEGHAELARQVIRDAYLPTARSAGLLGDVLMALSGHRVRWSPTLPIWLPDLELIHAGALELGEVEAAGLVLDGWWVAVVREGPRIIHSEVRAALNVEGSAAATLRAITVAATLRPGRPILTDDRWAVHFAHRRAAARSPDITVALATLPRDITIQQVQRTAAKAECYRLVKRSRRSA